jgi:hypothetical protein
VPRRSLRARFCKSRYALPPVMRAWAASSCTRDVEGMQNGPVDTERCGELQQLSWPGVAAAEIAMEGCQGSRSRSARSPEGALGDADSRRERAKGIEPS